MKEFKVGDVVWFVYGPDEEHHTHTVVGSSVVRKIGKMEDYWPKEIGVGLWFDDDEPYGDDWPPPVNTTNVFHTRQEALAEAIRQNEALSSELTVEIARLKEELAS